MRNFPAISYSRNLPPIFLLITKRGQVPGQGHDIASSVVPRVVIHSGPNGHLAVAVVRFVLLFLAPDLLVYTLVLKKFVLETFLVMRTTWSKKISAHKQFPGLSTASPRFVVMSVLPTFNLRASIKLLAPLNFFSVHDVALKSVGHRV